MNKYIWSLDISTTNVGFALWDINGKLVELKHLSLKTKSDIDVEIREYVKGNMFEEYCIEYKDKIEKKFNGIIEHIFVEAPLQNTPKNINTTALLLGFNGITRYVLHKIFGIYPKKISVHEIRKLMCPELVSKVKRKGKLEEVLSFPPEYRKDKKHYIWERVTKLEPQIEWFYSRNDTLKPICYDMSDAYACGIAGLKTLNII